MTTDINNSLREKIIYLYPAEAEAVYDKLQVILERYKKVFEGRPKSAVKSAFSEKDATLIAYADHVTTPGEKPFQTMRRFLSEFAGNYINKVHFLPFYPYSSDDGFAVIDYRQVKPEYGNWADLGEIHQDFRLMYDFVANHVSASSMWFQKFLQGDPTYRDYFLAFDEPIDTSSVYRPRTNPLLTRFETADGPKYVWTTFSADQIDLNVNNPDVFLALVDTLLFYIAHGADTIRFDAVGYLWKDPQTTSAHLPQTHMIIKIFRQIIDELATGASFITQANTRQELNLSYFGNGSDETNMVYNYSLPPLLLYTLIEGNAAKLTAWAQALAYPAGTATFLNITASHDGIGLQPLKGILDAGEIDRMIAHVSKNGAKVNFRTVSGETQEPYEINATYRGALGDEDAFIASQAIQLALRGVPGIYILSLFGAENWLEGVEQTGSNRTINRRKFEYASLKSELTDPHSPKYSVYTRYCHLLEVRRQEELFSPAVGQEILTLDQKVFVIRRSHDDDVLLALTNVSSESATVAGLDEVVGKASAINILDGTVVALDEPFELGRYDTVWLK